MFQCILCKFEVEFDDAIAPTAGGHCVCTRCFARETESERPMDPAYRKEINSVLTQETMTGV